MMNLERRVSFVEKAIQCLRCNQNGGNFNGIKPTFTTLTISDIGGTSSSTPEEIQQLLSTYILNNPLTIGKDEIRYIKIDGNTYVIQNKLPGVISIVQPEDIIQIGGGGSINETDLIFRASPSATITNFDISNWNSKLSSEVDTLQSVVNRGNISNKELIIQNNPIGAVASRLADNLYFGTTYTGTGYANTAIGDRALSVSSTGYGNTAIGGLALYLNTTGYSNTSVGLESLQSLTNGTSNTSIGAQSLWALTGLDIESRWNVAIGKSTGENLPKASSNVFIGTFTGKNLSSNISESDLSNISQAAVDYMKLVPEQSGYNSTTGTFNTALNTFVGQGINATTFTPTRAAMSTIIGASGLYNLRFRNFNNIIVGAGNYMAFRNATMYNSIVIGNSINLPNQEDVLSIGMNRNRRINSRDAIIYGLLPNTQLTFNAPITVPSTYMRNAQGDSTYTKQLVAKPNGDIGWEDKQSNSTTTGSITSFMNGITGYINWTKKGTKVIMELSLTFNASGYSGVLGSLPSVLRPLTMGSYVINMINGNNGSTANLDLQWGNGISLYNTALSGSFNGVIEYESYN